jgi:hypothetical protein
MSDQKSIKAPEKPPARWYELDWLLPYKDLMLIAGGALVVAGVAMMTVAGSLIVAGSALAFLAWRMAAR